MPTTVRDERGFTLIELLVVILIVGILAAIALPTFLGQQAKAQDTDAKANARQLVTHVEACFADTQSYANCTPANMDPTGLPIGSTKGKVDVTATSANGYTILAKSISGNTFTYVKDLTNGATRSCTGTTGGCRGGTW
jgi:type IV pilus assembly protein PilA